MKITAELLRSLDFSDYEIAAFSEDHPEGLELPEPGLDRNSILMELSYLIDVFYFLEKTKGSGVAISDDGCYEHAEFENGLRHGLTYIRDTRTASFHNSTAYDYYHYYEKGELKATIEYKSKNLFSRDIAKISLYLAGCEINFMNGGLS